MFSKMMKSRLLWIFPVLLVMFGTTSCLETPDNNMQGPWVETWRIASELKEVPKTEGSSELVKAMQIMSPSSGIIYLTVDAIEGFTYEEGFAYVIQVQITPVATDEPGTHKIEFKMLKLISKEAKKPEPEKENTAE